MNLYKFLLRAALLYKKQPEVFCFHNFIDGLKHFSATTSVKATKLPPPNETEQIKKEQESLPPLGWLVNDVFSTAVRNADLSRALITSALASQSYLGPLVDMSELAKTMAALRPLVDTAELAKAIRGPSTKKTDTEK